MSDSVQTSHSAETMRSISVRALRALLFGEEAHQHEPRMGIRNQVRLHIGSAPARLKRVIEQRDDDGRVAPDKVRGVPVAFEPSAGVADHARDEFDALLRVEFFSSMSTVFEGFRIVSQGCSGPVVKNHRRAFLSGIRGGAGSGCYVVGVEEVEDQRERAAAVPIRR